MRQAEANTGTIRSYMLFFLISNTQLADPILRFQKSVYAKAGHDAWLCMILVALVTHAACWCVVKTMEYYPQLDLYAIHRLLFGRWVGGALNGAYALYLLLLCLTVLRSYTEIVQTWLLPEMPGWLFGLLFSLLLLYGVSGGIRTITGAAFIFFITSLWLFLLYYFPWKYGSWEHLLPMLEASWRQLAQGTYSAIYTMVGFELVYFVYPFVKDKQKVMAKSQLAIFFTMMTYVSAMMNAIVFYSGEQLLHMVWPTFSWYELAQFSFLERFDLVASAYWLMLILPGCLLFLWAATRGMKAVLHVKQKHALYACCLLLAFSADLFPGRESIHLLLQLSGNAALYMAFVYPPILYAIVRWKKGRTTEGRETNEASSRL